MRNVLIALLLACAIDRAQSISNSAVTVNCGGPAAGFYDADQFFSGSSAVYSDPSLGAAEWVDMRYGLSFSYDVPMANGIYTVTLELVEPNATGVGQRVFGITANGVASGPIDLFKITGGAKIQYMVTLPFLVGNGSLHLQFTGTGGKNAVVSAFAISAFGTTIIKPDPGPVSISVHQERPGGTMDGTNAVFTIAHTPFTPIDLWRNGIYQTAGVDYTFNGMTSITFLAGAIPQPNDLLVINYSYAGPSIAMLDFREADRSAK